MNVIFIILGIICLIIWFFTKKINGNYRSSKYYKYKIVKIVYEMPREWGGSYFIIKQKMHNDFLGGWFDYSMPINSIAEANLIVDQLIKVDNELGTTKFKEYDI